MKKLLLAFTLILGLSFASKGQSISLATSSLLYEGDMSVIIAVNGTSTHFLSGADSLYLIHTSSSDTIYPFYNIPPTADGGKGAEFNLTCNQYALGVYDLYAVNLTDGVMSIPGALTLNQMNVDFQLSAYDPSCHGANDGSLSSYPIYNGSGGPQGLDILWNTGDTIESFYSVYAGSYTLTVTGQNDGCVADTTIVLTDPAPVTGSINWVHAECDSTNGYAYVVNISGGIGSGYQAHWPGEISADSVFNLAPGNYTVQLVDGNNCSLYIDFTIESRLSFDISTVPGDCMSPVGSASVTPLSGIAPFTALWSNGDTGFSADSLSPGTHSVTIIDVNGCSGTSPFQITSSNGPSITSVVTNSPSCSGANTGSIDVTVSGGTTPYSFHWSNGNNTEDLNSVPAGYYELTIVDATGCTFSECFDIADPTPLSIDFLFSYAATCGFSDGIVSVQAMGGTSPYSYQWDANLANATTQDVYNVGSGMYSVTISDAAGCTLIDSVYVSDSNGPYITLLNYTNTSCGLAGGMLDVSVTGGTFPYTFSWSNGATTEDISGIDPGKYVLTVVDAANCKTYYTDYIWDYSASVGQDICLVTVDSLTGNNLVVWEKDLAVTNIDHYNIYRESCDQTGYIKIGEVPYDSLSQFLDPGALANIRSWKYRMSTVDICGQESEVSPLHKTIHLNVNRLANGNAQINWDIYTGFSYTEQYLWRYEPAGTGWNIIDTLPAGTFSYLDVTTPPSGLVQYTIEIYPTAPCIADRAVNHNSTRSNRGTLASPNGINELVSISVSVFPNPSQGVFRFEVDGESPTYFIEVLDMAGRKVLSSMSNANGTIDLTNYPKGIYLLNVSTKDQPRTVIKLVRQ